MKKISLLWALICLFAVLSGCQKTTPAQPQPPTASQPESPAPQVSEQPQTPDPVQTPDDTMPLPETAEPPVQEEPQSPQVTAPRIKPGTWMTGSDGEGEYYFFDEDGTSGRTASYETGTGIPFSYEHTADKTLFYMGGADTPARCGVVVTDDSHITLEWESRSPQELSFVSPLDSDHFHFYTNEELCDMALKDYEAKYGPLDSPLSAAAADNQDGTAIIQLYQNLSDHNSTAAWYCIDRRTGEGTNINSGDPIDLTDGSPDVEIGYLDPADSSLPPDCHRYTVTESQYACDLLLAPLTAISDFALVSVELVPSEDSYDTFRITEELLTLSRFTPQQPLILRLELPEIIPNVGITYIDQNGSRVLYTISVSGLDGAPLLIESRIS